MGICKCRFPSGVDVKPDGVHSLDPCQYKLVERHKNVTVDICQCERCGGIDISWRRQDNTKSETFGYLIDTDDYDFDDEVPWAEENPNL
jgi:hypothetical protein